MLYLLFWESPCALSRGRWLRHQEGIIASAIDQGASAPHGKAGGKAHPTNADAQKFPLGSMFTITLGHAANDIYVSFLPPLLPLFIANLGLSHTRAGLLSLLRQTPSLLQPAIGHLADRVDLRTWIILTPAVTAVMTSLLGLAPSYTALALLLVVAGMSTAAFHAVTPALAGELAGQSNVGRGIGLWIFGGEVGFTLGPLLIVTVVDRFGLRATPWLVFIGLLGSLVLFFRLRSIPYRVAQSAASLPWRQALSQARHNVAPLLGLVVTRSLAMSALSNYLPTYLSEAGTGFWLAGASLTVFQAAASLGVLVGGSLSDRLGRRVVMASSTLLPPLVLFAFLALDGTARLLTLLAIGFVVAPFDPAAIAAVQESATHNRALASSVYLSLSFIIRSVAVVAVGALADWIGLRWAFVLSTVVFLLGTPLLLLLPAGLPKTATD
jgi:FSR family fosmidomycin resistance protein-like MFS transporter